LLTLIIVVTTNICIPTVDALIILNAGFKDVIKFYKTIEKAAFVSFHVNVKNYCV